MIGVIGLTALAMPSGTPLGAQPVADWGAVTAKAIERMGLRPGARVLLVGVPGEADALVDAFRAALRSAGATELGALGSRGATPDAWQTAFTRQAAAASGAVLDSLLAGIDVAIMLPGAAPADPAYAAMQRLHRAGRGTSIHFHWAGMLSANGTPVPLTPADSRLYERAILQADYAVLARVQREFERALRAAPVRVTTPAGTDITFRVGDRPVTRQDGDASPARAREWRNLVDREVELPAGAMRVAPIESSVNGRIAIAPSGRADTPVEGLVLTVVSGRVTRIEASRGAELVTRQLDSAGGGSRMFREFVLGLNPLLATPDTGARRIAYYGYGAGVVRISLGDNTELGGPVTGGRVTQFFFTDATVRVGDETWVRDGKLAGPAAVLGAAGGNGLGGSSGATAAAAPRLLRPRDVDSLPSRDADARIPYGRDSLQFGDLRLPAGRGPFPVAVVVHGGCWLARFATLRNTAALADALRDAGVATWNVEYRRNDHPGGGWPGTFLDVADATDHVRELARRYPLDTTRVVTIGHSAGAHLALWIAGQRRIAPNTPLSRVNPLVPRAVVALGGPGDLAEFAAREERICGPRSASGVMGGQGTEVPERYAVGSPINLLPLGVPQVMIAGDRDGVLPRAVGEAYVAAARARGDEASLVTVEGAGHFEVIAPGSVAWPAVRDAVLRAVR